MLLLTIDVTLVTEFHEVEGRFTFLEPRGREEIYPIIHAVWKETAEKVLSLHQEKVSVLGIVFDVDNIGNREASRLAFWKFFTETRPSGVNVSWSVVPYRPSNEERKAQHGEDEIRIG